MVKEAELKFAAHKPSDPSLVAFWAEKPSINITELSKEEIAAIIPNQHIDGYKTMQGDVERILHDLRHNQSFSEARRAQIDKALAILDLPGASLQGLPTNLQKDLYRLTFTARREAAVALKTDGVLYRTQEVISSFDRIATTSSGQLVKVGENEVVRQAVRAAIEKVEQNKMELFSKEASHAAKAREQDFVTTFNRKVVELGHPELQGLAKTFSEICHWGGSCGELSSKATALADRVFAPGEAETSNLTRFSKASEKELPGKNFSERIEAARLAQEADQKVAPAISLRGRPIYDSKGFAELSPIGQREILVADRKADELADLRGKFLRGEIAKAELDSGYKLRDHSPPVGSAEKQRIALLNEEENYRANRATQAWAYWNEARGAEKDKLENAFRQATAEHLRAQEQRNGAVSAYWIKATASEKSSRQARLDGITSLPRAFERYADQFPGRSLAQVLQNPQSQEIKLLRSLWRADVRNGALLQKEGNEAIRRALKEVVDSKINPNVQDRGCKFFPS